MTQPAKGKRALLMATPPTSGEALVAVLREKIVQHAATVGVLGLGYVGLPLAVEKAKVGFQVVGFDVNPERVTKVNRSENYIPDVKDEELARMVGSGRLSATTNFDHLREMDVIVICVPTPLTVTRDPDISYIVASTRAIAKVLTRGHLISLESTTFPGTTDEVILPILEETGMRVGEDFFLAHSPERVDPGNQRYTTHNISKVVGGVTPHCLDVAVAFYAQTVERVVPVSSARVAEITKVFENTYRAVNIALVNEMALLCDRMGLNVWELLDAAATKPFGIHIFYPGPGVGGHCIPVDPFYLTWKAREFEFHTRFIELAGEINAHMPYFVLEKTARALNRMQKSIRGSRVLVLGVAYKKDADDVRESPALKVIELLLREGADVFYHDPYIPAIRHRGQITYEMRSVPLTSNALQSTDCVVILTDHSKVDYQFVVRNAPVVLDTRNATKHVETGLEKVVKL